jgi:redox-sensitive bicupin YhaK (pirin superfamily)
MSNSPAEPWAHVADLYDRCTDDPHGHGRETTVYDGIHAKISPRSEVLRLLPHRERRMVGAWCFVDLYGPRPVAVGDGDAMHVAPHPHTGLQTVSWLVTGEVTHRDSLGTTAQVVPGRVAVMTAGEGIAHAEDVVPPTASGGMLHGAQLWVALPDVQRHGERDFVLHEPAPFLEADGVLARVFVGSLGGVTSGAQAFTPLVGAELTPTVEGTARVPLERTYEHVLVPLAGAATVEGVTVEHGQAMYLGVDRSVLALDLSADARVLLLGGEPFAEEIVMWWNFVARSHEEIERARERWNAGGDARFGEVGHYPTNERLAAPPLPNVRLQPRGRVRPVTSPPGSAS